METVSRDGERPFTRLLDKSSGKHTYRRTNNDEKQTTIPDPLYISKFLAGLRGINDYSFAITLHT